MSARQLRRLRVRAHVDGPETARPARQWRGRGRAVVVHRVGDFVGMVELDGCHVVAEGIFALDPATLGSLERWAKGERPAVAPGLGAGGLIVGDVAHFAKRLSNRCDRLGVPLAGFDVPALLVGVAEHVGRSGADGLSLALLGLRFTGRDGRRRDDTDRARVRMVPRGADAGAFVQWLKPRDPSGVRARGRRRAFLGLRTLAGALGGGEPADPATACRWFGVEWPCPAANARRRLRRELAALVQLYLATTDELQQVAPGLDPAAVWSGGSIAGHLLARAGVPRWDEKVAGLPRAQVGAMAAAFRGGRTEARLVGVAVPAVLVDITATYPTVFSLLDLSRFLAAGRVDSEDVTEELREFLAAPDLLDQLYRRETWRRWGATFARVRPRGEVLPSTVEWTTRSVGGTVASLDLGGATLPLHWSDVAAGVVEGGRVPEIVEAWRLTPGPAADGLVPVRMPSGATVDLAADDLGAAFLAERERWRADGSAAGRRRLAMAKGVDVAATFGQFARVDPGRGRAGSTGLGPDGETLRSDRGRSERAGPWCAFPLAAAVCAGARLIVALGIRGVADFGGVVAHVATDSMLVPAAPDGGSVPCPGALDDRLQLLSWDQVRSVVARFEALGVQWKAESGSLDQPTTALVAGVNKVVLGRRDLAGRLRIVRSSDSGIVRSSDTDLGWVVDPTGTDRRLADGRMAWVAQVQVSILSAAVRRGPDLPLAPGDLPPWCARPALRRVAPMTWRELQLAREALGDPALKPYTVLLRASGGALAVDTGCGPDGWPLLDWRWRGERVSLFSLDAQGAIVPFGGRGSLSVHVDTVGDHLARWLRENDRSMAGPDRGLRQPVAVESAPGLIGVFGRDGGRLAAADDDRDATDQLAYGAPLGELRAAVRAVGASAVAKASGLNARTVQRYVDSTRTPDARAVAKISEALASVATGAERRCPGPGCAALLTARQRWCSPSCKRAAWRVAHEVEGVR